ncbi:l-serine dehydratase [Aspergillus sp. HF37]|nr:l-serine dehydratase [Aspergillus sp. HF37]
MGSISQEKQFKTPWVETPLVESAPLSRAAGCRIFLKLENVQPSGSFKSRAMGSQILSHLQKPENANRPVHFFASSGGNAGLAAVCAARSLGYPCTVVVPTSTKPLMFRKLVTAGAHEVIQHGESIWEAGEFMKNELMQKMEPSEPADIAKIALHPFDSQSIWDGNSSIVDELVAQLPPPESAAEKEVYGTRPAALDGIVCSVGGGGLLNGLIMGLERHGQVNPKLRQQTSSTSTSTAEKNPIRLLAIETAGTDSLATAMNSNSLVSLPKITSQATSLGAIRVSEKTFNYAVNPPPGMTVHSSVLSDADAARGVLRLADEERLLVELACGVCVEAVVGDGARARREQGRQGERGVKRRRVTAAAAAAGKHRDEGYGDDRSTTDEEGPSAGEGDEELGSKLKQLVPELKEDSRVVIVVCGGSNVTIDMAAEYHRLLDEGWE